MNIGRIEHLKEHQSIGLGGMKTQFFLHQHQIQRITVELGITRLPTRLSSSNTTSWLGNNAPALLLYGCLAEAFKFLKGPAEMLQMYEQSYQRALQELMIEQQGRHRRDEYMHGALRTPLQSHNP